MSSCDSESYTTEILDPTSMTAHGVSDTCLYDCHPIPKGQTKYFLPVNTIPAQYTVTHANIRQIRQNIYLETDAVLDSTAVAREPRRIHAFGTFCRPECVRAYADENYPNNNDIKTLISQLYFKKQSSSGSPIQSAPSKTLLKKFGGEMSIEEFRRSYSYTSRGSQFVLTEELVDVTDFYVPPGSVTVVRVSELYNSIM